MKIIVIGGGPGGYEAAIRGAQLGGEVVLIEKHKLGGTCLNEGCIPTKVLYKNASLLKDIRKSSHHGIVSNVESVDIEKMLLAKNEIIHHQIIGINELIKANEITYIEGEAELIDAHRVLVAGEIIAGDYIIIGTGSEPVMPSIPGIDHDKILNSSEMLSLNVIPESLTIIGAGVIGIEFAGIYHTLGSKVTLIDSSKNILQSIDKDVSKRLSSMMKKEGIEIITDASVSHFSSQEDIVDVHYTKKGKSFNIGSEYVLVSVGRKPRFLKGLDGLIDYDHRGIVVDENYRTNQPSVYAIGDVNGINMLAHVASHQGHSAVEHILLEESALLNAVVPSCIFSFPEIAVVGESEKSLKEKVISYDISKFSFSHNGKAVTMQEAVGFIKVLAVNDIIVGVQIIGPHASDLIHEGALGIQNQLKVSDCIKVIHAHPTLSEAFLEAARGLHDKAIHQLPKRTIKLKKNVS